jgi:hypothetical protein
MRHMLLGWQQQRTQQQPSRPPPPPLPRPPVPPAPRQWFPLQLCRGLWQGRLQRQRLLRRLQQRWGPAHWREGASVLDPKVWECY